MSPEERARFKEATAYIAPKFAGMFSDGFGRGWGKNSEEVEKNKFFKKVWEHLSRIRLPLTRILGLCPEENIR